MAYDENLVNKIRESLVDVPNVIEKYMFGGVCFMVDNKMCVGVLKDEMMCRINPYKMEEVLEMLSCRQMDFTGRPMKGYVFITQDGVNSKKKLDFWVNLCLEYNLIAKASKKKLKKK